MKREIKVPAMGESINEATVSAILKKPGSVVQMDDELLELATDKVNQVLYAPDAGIFTPSVKEDDVVTIGQVVGFIETSAGAAVQPEKKAKTAESIPVEPKKEVPAKAAIPVAVEQGKARITSEDFLESLKTPPTLKAAEPQKPPAQKTAPAVQVSPSTSERETRRKMSKIRKIIASRLVEVQQTTAMLTTFNEVDLTEVMSLREKYKEAFTKEHGAKLGLMSFFVKAAVSALRKFPEVNSYIDGDDIVHREYYDIGIAVGTERGLVVPIVRDCDKLSFAEVESTIASYAAKVKEGKLSADDLQGGGFTITNGGVYGSLLSTPILNPRQCAILGMHKIMKRPMVINDQIVIRQMMYLALSYDHRIIDGKEAVSFLIHIKNWLEDPARMLLNI